MELIKKEKKIIFIKEAWGDIKKEAAAGWTAGGVRDLIKAIKEERKARKELDSSRREYYNSIISVKKAEMELYKSLGKKDEIKEVNDEIVEIVKELNTPTIIKNIEIIYEALKNSIKYIKID